jgi:hypothetical protein
MKRKKPQGTSFRGVIKPIGTNFTKDQLASIGAVAMAYNEAEQSLHYLTSRCFRSPFRPEHITSRINGSEGLVAIVREAALALRLPDDTNEVVIRALEAFMELKNYRDAVIHAKMANSLFGIGETQVKRGSRPDDVLLTVAALDNLYNRLSILDFELFLLEHIMMDAMVLNDISSPDDPKKQLLEQSIRAGTVQCQDHQRSRLALPPFPKFSDVDAWRESLQHKTKPDA